MGMLIASILLLIAALFYISTKKNAANLILSVVFLVASIGCFGSYMEVSMLPSLKIRIDPNSHFLLFMEYLSSLFLSLGHYLPYSILLIFAIYFSGYMEEKKKIEHIFIVMIIFIPSIICFTLFSVDRQFKPDFKFLSIWCGIYLIISIFIFRSTYKRALTIIEKNNRLFVSMIVIPSSFLHYIFVNITQAFGNRMIWRYSYIIVAIAFIVYIFFIIRFGAFGLKIKIEKIKMDTAIRTINTSTVIFNHAVKNEVSKISMCASTIKSFQDRIECPDMREKISLSTEIIEDSASHLLSLVSRIKETSKPIVLNENTMSLHALIEHVVKVYSKIDDKKNVSFHVISDYSYITQVSHFRK
ncbi:MAG: hypothetical protein BWY74_03389 [Firmicutes bacterium ADurb.Bin419]|nr:MAG: hypothetical protein BWY74_03389 [Firmicutes bacterium ADurb.Bin419]